MLRVIPGLVRRHAPKRLDVLGLARSDLPSNRLLSVATETKRDASNNLARSRKSEGSRYKHGGSESRVAVQSKIRTFFRLG